MNQPADSLRPRWIAAWTRLATGRSRETRSKHIVARLAVLFVASAAPVAIGYGAIATGCPPGAVTDAGGGWTRIAPPTFSAGTATLTAYVVPSQRPRELFASNGTAIARSTDWGCTWTQTFALSDVPSIAVPVSARTAKITALVADGAARYAVVTDSTRLVVLRSADDGTTWTVGTGALVQTDANATDAKLLPAPDGKALYLVSGVTSQTASTTGRLVYVSTDGGASWATSPIPATIAQLSSTAVGPAVMLDFAVDGVNPRTMFAGTTIGLLRSDDAGATWRPSGVPGRAAMDSVVTGAIGTRPTVLAIDNTKHIAYVSRDDGATWAGGTAPESVQSASIDPAQFVAVTATSDGVYQIRFDTATFGPMWTREPRLSNISFDRSPTPYVYACSCNQDTDVALWRSFDTMQFSEKTFTAPPPPISLPGLFDESYTCYGTMPTIAPAKIWEPSVLSPVSPRIALEPGQSRTIPYHLHAAPREMDVYYLAETGDKMEFSLCHFETGAVVAANALNPVRNLSVGVGPFREYAGFADEWNTTASYLYQRRLAMARPNRLLGDQLQRLRMDIEPDRGAPGALYQAVTGAGQDLGPVGASPEDIAPGQQAEYSPDAFKVAFVVTGAWYNEPARTPHYPGPSSAAVIDLLRQHRVHTFGVWINNAGNKQTQEKQAYAGRLDMFRFAEATGSTAPHDIDCNHDGYVDVRRGEGLVCDFLTGNDTDGKYTTLGDPTLGKEMSTLLLAIEDREDVTLVPRVGAAAVGAVSPAKYENVELLKRSDHDFDVTFHCGAAQTNETVPVTIDAVAGGVPIAQSDVVLQCGHAPPPPVIHAAAIIVPPPPPPAPNPLPGPVPNPGPAPAPNPAPNPAQMPQAQTQPVAHGVPVVQQQKAPQLAFQRATNELQANEAMSSLPPPARDPLGPARRLALVGGACLTAAAATAKGVLARATSRGR